MRVGISSGPWPKAPGAADGQSASAGRGEAKTADAIETSPAKRMDNRIGFRAKMLTMQIASKSESVEPNLE